jgi:hypothetical protein
MAAAGRTKDVSRQGLHLLANEADSCSSLALLPHPLGTWTPCDIPHNAGACYAAWPQSHCEKARSPSAYNITLRKDTQRRSAFSMDCKLDNNPYEQPRIEGYIEINPNSVQILKH